MQRGGCIIILYPPDAHRCVYRCNTDRNNERNKMAIIYDIDAKKDDLRALLPEVLQAYKQTPVKNVSRKYKVCCPYHSERTPSCEIDPKKGVFYCFGCGKGGDVFDIVAEEENLNLEDWRDFQKVAKIIADIGNIQLPEKSQDPDKDKYKDKQPTPTTRPPRNSTPIPPRRIRYIKPHEWQNARRFYRETSLYHWLCSEFDRADVERVLEAYCFGGADFVARNGYRAAFFPYISAEGKCVDCKIYHFNPLTGSRKTADPIYSWTDRETGEQKNSSTTFLLYELMREAQKKGKISNNLKTQDFRADWCGFGDHLLPSMPDTPICVVESEKTAIVAALTYPDRIWIAVGGKEQFNPTGRPGTLAPYRGRKIIIYPDRDGYEDKVRKDGKSIELGWRTLARLLAKEGFSVYVDTTIERHYTEFVLDDNGNIVIENGEPKRSKKDLADLIIEYKHGVIKPKKEQPYKSPEKEEAEKVFEEMKRNNPIFAELAETFQLEPISIEHLEPVAVQSQTTAQKDYE